MPDTYDSGKTGISKAPAYKSLKKGDPWTFLNCSVEQMAIAHELHAANRPTARWFDTSEPGRLFKVTRIDDQRSIIETVYLGFQAAPGSDDVQA